MQLPPKGQQLVAQNHSFRMEKREARAFRLEAEQIKFFAQFTMITAFRFRQHEQVVIQFFLAAEGGTVDTLQHFIFFIAAPVGARDAHQFERFDLAGRNDVRARAKVGKFALRVEGNGFVRRQIADQFFFINFSLGFEMFHRRVAFHHFAHEFVVFLHDLFHFFFDRGEIFRREHMLGVHVVVKAVINRRSDREFRIRPQTQNRLRHNMRRRMTDRVQAFGARAVKKFDLSAVDDRTR